MRIKKNEKKWKKYKTEDIRSVNKMKKIMYSNYFRNLKGMTTRLLWTRTDVFDFKKMKRCYDKRQDREKKKQN